MGSNSDGSPLGRNPAKGRGLAARTVRNSTTDGLPKRGSFYRKTQDGGLRRKTTAALSGAGLEAGVPKRSDELDTVDGSALTV